MAVFLRDYQEAAKADVRAAMRVHRRVCLVMPTGAGKTVTFCSIGAMVWSRGMRCYLGAHRIEIVLQIAAALRAEGVRYGIIAPGYPETSAPVQVFMVQTMVHRLARYPRPDFLVLDECHHAVATGYQKLLAYWDGIFTLGVTATPARLDGKGLADAFDTMVLGPSMAELMARGYLCRYSYFAPPIVADLDKLRTRAGDYTSAEAAAAMDQRSVTGDAEAHYRKMLGGRPAIAFCSSVEHAEHVAEGFRARGWKAASVDGSMDAGRRAALISAIGDGRLNVLASCDIISEGTDIPVVQGAIMLRPTLSTVIYMQQSGRVLRPKKDGSRAVILDHVGNVLRHGLPDAAREWSLTASPKRAQAAAVRSCPACYLAFAPAPRCPGCGRVFVAPSAARVAAKQVAGELREVGENPLATGDLKALLRRAHTRADIQAIADARGYKPGWVTTMLHFKQQARGHFRRRA